VAHTCNPSYSAEQIRKTEVQSQSGPVQANSSQDLISKIPYSTQGWRSGSNGKSSCLGNLKPSVQIPVLPKKKKKRRRRRNQVWLVLVAHTYNLRFLGG
jgi:hypothetical protein